MTTVLPRLPVSEALPRLLQVLRNQRSAVLVAPPGAGKTTLVPLALLDEKWRGDGRILLLEPRRLAARAAARRMAALLGEEPGQRVGYAMRMENRQSLATRILVVTEGVLARMILDDPELPGIAAILFDEFHERSLDGDFGLALALDVQGALRPDLRLIVMSATLDGARVAAMMGDAQVVESEGRAFPVELRYRDKGPDTRIEEAMAQACLQALAQERGSILAFLPGQAEIERTRDLLGPRLPADVDLALLFGGLDTKAQDAAIRPAPPGRRKLVLATSIAETSITIEGIRVVIDSGLARLPRYEPATGLTRLQTVRVSRASAEQRAGRAGRTEPGVAIRLWRAEQTAALPAFSPPEIAQADLSALVLDCSAFGVSDPTSLAFLDPPPAAALAEAKALLRELGALDIEGRLTPAGQAIRKLSLPVRLGHMVTQASDKMKAAELAVLLTERGLGGTSIDLDHRLQRFASERSARAQAARGMARRLTQSAAQSAREKPRRAPAERTGGKNSGGESSGRGIAEPSTGALLALAYPDRVARARGEHGRFVLANGRGAVLDAVEPLAGAPFLVIADLQGKAQNARIAAAAAISEEEIFDQLREQLQTTRETHFDTARRSLRTRETVRLGAIRLTERQIAAPHGEAADRALIAAIGEHGLDLLDWSRGATMLRRRLAWLHQGLGAPWPDMGDAALLASLDEWLAPYLQGKASLASVAPTALSEGLMSLVPYDLQHRIDRLAPTHYAAPSGSSVPIRYDEEQAVLSIRVQELFGLDHHPSIANGTVALTLELLSPAQRPIQTTRDLPGFWRGSWADVRAEMRGRYPRHHWPENPLEAVATSRAKKRG